MTEGAGSAAPLILTVVLDDASQDLFDRLRRAHFPPERNHLRAHVTLFHKLPGHETDAVLADVRAASGRPRSSMTVTGVRFLGRGVAYELAAPAVESVRRELAARWEPWLGAQDRQRFRPHVTVQNKVAPETARALHARLVAGFVPFEVEAMGLSLWRYLGGPWSLVESCPFNG